MLVPLTRPVLISSAALHLQGVACSICPAMTARPLPRSRHCIPDAGRFTGGRSGRSSQVARSLRDRQVGRSPLVRRNSAYKSAAQSGAGPRQYCRGIRWTARHAGLPGTHNSTTSAEPAAAFPENGQMKRAGIV